jgi:hypothetical protein
MALESLVVGREDVAHADAVLRLLTVASAGVV